MAIRINGTTGIDMGNTPVSNVDVGVLPENATTRQYVDDLKTIATGTATFDATTNNINLTGIGVGVEIGDVIQISGAEDVKNNSEFTIEVITDDDNITVNQAHANKGTAKNVAPRVSDIGVTVKLLSKWYNAPTGLGQGWVDVTTSRSFGVSYSNNTFRCFQVSILANYTNIGTQALNIFVDGKRQNAFVNVSDTASPQLLSVVAGITSKSTYYATDNATVLSIVLWSELR